MRFYLGLSSFQWALVACGALSGTFAVALVYRLLISHRPEHEAFMRPAEIQMTLHHIRNVNRAVVAFGVAAAVSLVLIGAARALGLF